MRIRDVVLRIFASETPNEREERARRAAETHAHAATTRSKIDTLLSETKEQNRRIRNQLP